MLLLQYILGVGANNCQTSIVKSAIQVHRPTPSIKNNLPEFADKIRLNWLRRACSVKLVILLEELIQMQISVFKFRSEKFLLFPSSLTLVGYVIDFLW